MKFWRLILIGIGLAGVLGLFAAQIRTLETLKTQGRTVLLELRPADPRAFMQGDYMQLAYDQERAVRSDADTPSSGHVILKLDQHDVGTFVRMDAGENLAEGEVRLAYAMRRRWLGYGSTRYYFQEGTAQDFDAARYGVFKVSNSGRAILIALADKDRKIISPN